MSFEVTFILNNMSSFINQSQTMDLFKVVSFNLRRQTRFDRKYRWQRRKEIAAEVIRRSGASVIGVQELLPGMRKDVSSMLDDYSIIGSGRFPSAGCLWQ